MSFRPNLLTRVRERTSQTMTSAESSSVATRRPVGETAAAKIGAVVGPTVSLRNGAVVSLAA
jgi:hypothetical protein